MNHLQLPLTIPSGRQIRYNTKENAMQVDGLKFKFKNNFFVMFSSQIANINFQKYPNVKG
jgi:hypothetical protein